MENSLGMEFWYSAGWDDAKCGVTDMALEEEDFDNPEEWMAYESGYEDYLESVR